MNDNFLKTLIFLISVFLVSCSKPRGPYLISNFNDINLLEEADHQSCINLKLNFDTNNNLDSKLYWHCRLSFSKFHLEINPVFPNQIDFNQKITDLITQISLIISKNQTSYISKEIDKLEEIDHKKCLKLGYNNESRDIFVIEEYYQCRKNLIELNFSEPPFNNAEYEKYQNKSYDIAFVIDKRIKKSFQDNERKIAENPECASFRPTSDEFKKCIDSINKFKQCNLENSKKIREIEAQEKIICQRQAYIRFNDEMIKESERTENRIKNRNLNSDRDNRNNFESFGIDEDDFLGKEQKEEAKEIKIKKQFSINNTNKGIYSRQEISKLRKNFINNCIGIVNSKISKLNNKFINDCEKLKFTKPQ